MRTITPHAIVVGGLMGHGLADFHAGARPALERIFREQFESVSATVGRVVEEDADRETVVHDVFVRLFTDARLRRSFAGGALGGWLATLARRHAVEHQRRRECALPEDVVPVIIDADFAAQAAEAAQLVEHFRTRVLPMRWVRVFELRFLDRLDRDRAARALGIGKLRLLYREERVRRLLSRYLRRLDRV